VAVNKIEEQPSRAAAGASASAEPARARAVLPRLAAGGSAPPPYLDPEWSQAGAFTEDEESAEALAAPPWPALEQPCVIEPYEEECTTEPPLAVMLECLEADEGCEAILDRAAPLDDPCIMAPDGPDCEDSTPAALEGLQDLPGAQILEDDPCLVAPEVDGCEQ
jgi:hypothetical protein